MPKRYKLEEMTPELVNRAEAWALYSMDFFDGSEETTIMVSSDIEFVDENSDPTPHFNAVIRHHGWEYQSGWGIELCPGFISQDGKFTEIDLQ